MSAARPSGSHWRVPALAWLLCTALLLSQWAGLAHRVAHGGVHGAHAAHETYAAHAADGPRAASPAALHGVLYDACHDECHGGSADAAHGGADAAWQDTFEGHDEGGAECRLYDQLSHADTLTAAPLHFVGPGLRELPGPGGSVGRGAPCCSAYLARAPPRG